MNKNTDKGFTLLELLIVITIIGILALLATPKIGDAVKKAKTTQIVHDIRVTETAVDLYTLKNGSLPEDWPYIDNTDLNLLKNSKLVYGREGIKKEIENKRFMKISDQFLDDNVRTHLTGTFLTSEDGIVYYIDKNADSLSFKFDRETENPVNNDNIIKLIDSTLPNGIYRNGDKLNGNLKIQSFVTDGFDIKVSFINVQTSESFIWDKTVEFNENETKDVPFEYNIDNNMKTGFYNIQISIFRDGTEVQRYVRINTIYIYQNGFRYFVKADLTTVDMEEMGRIGKLSSANVDITDNHSLKENTDFASTNIKIPGKSNSSGQIRTKIPITYGTYESSIMVPDNDGLLNGFILYGEDAENPSITYEVDIEILKYEGKWQVWSTVFNISSKLYDENNGLEPGVIYQSKKILDIDPSENFHNYKIDFYQEYISFYMDDKEIAKWNNRFDYGDMYLYTGTFYTHWLSGNFADIDQNMKINWIRQSFKDR